MLLLVNVLLYSTSKNLLYFNFFYFTKQPNSSTRDVGTEYVNTRTAISVNKVVNLKVVHGREGLESARVLDPQYVQPLETLRGQVGDRRLRQVPVKTTSLFLFGVALPIPTKNYRGQIGGGGITI